jgi:hypothetical protein
MVKDPRPRILRDLLPRAAALAAVCVLAAPATAALYKWVDANGRVTYSDQPPSGDVKAEIVSAPAAPANPAAVREMANQEADFKKRQNQRATDQKKAAQAQQDEANRRQFCADIRNQIKIYDSGLVVQKVDATGTPLYMDDNAKRAEKARLETIVRERCGAEPIQRAAGQ